MGVHAGDEVMGKLRLPSPSGQDPFSVLYSLVAMSPHFWLNVAAATGLESQHRLTVLTSDELWPLAVALLASGCENSYPPNHQPQNLRPEKETLWTHDSDWDTVVVFLWKNVKYCTCSFFKVVVYFGLG